MFLASVLLTTMDIETNRKRVRQKSSKSGEVSNAAPVLQAPSDGKAETLNADRPIQSPLEDRFNRLPFSKRVAHAIMNRPDSSSLVIGVYGKWGDGKTSVLNLMCGEIQSDSRFVIVRFNPCSLVTKLSY
jgi:hypothetical protein